MDFWVYKLCWISSSSWSHEFESMFTLQLIMSTSLCEANLFGHVSSQYKIPVSLWLNQVHVHLKLPSSCVINLLSVRDWVSPLSLELRYEQTERQRYQCWSMVTLQNRPPPPFHFQASQYYNGSNGTLPLDAHLAARSVHALRKHWRNQGAKR